MPVYYIDFNRGDDLANDGLSPLTPWKTQAKITSFASAQPGDAFLLADDSVFQFSNGGRIVPQTSWRGQKESPVILGKFSPSSQSVGQMPIIIFNEITTAGQWVYNAPLNGWCYLYPTQHINRALLVRLNKTWVAFTTDMTVGAPVEAKDGHFNILSQAQTLSIFGVDQGSRAIVLWAPAGVNPVDYYGEVVISPQATGAIGLSAGRHWITVQDIAFTETGCGVLMYSNNAEQTGYVVRRCRMKTGGALVTMNADAGGALRGWVLDNDVEDFGAIGIHVNTGSAGQGLISAEIAYNRIRDGVRGWAQGGIYLQGRNTARESVVQVHHNDISFCRWGTRDKAYDGCGIYAETGSDGALIFNNVIHDMFMAMQDNSGRRNYWIGNLVYNVRRGIRISDQSNNGLCDCRMYNNTMIVGDLNQRETEWGNTTQGADYPGVWMYRTTGTLNADIRNNLIANIGGQRGRAVFGLPDVWPASSYTFASNWVFGFESDQLVAGTNAAPSPSPPTVTNAGTSDPRPFLDAGFALKAAGYTELSPNPLATVGQYIQGIKLRNGRMRPGACPVGAYQAMLPRTQRVA